MDIPVSFLEKIKRGKCVLFLGSGASFSSGGPLGTELGEYIRDNIVYSDDLYDDDLALYTEKLLDNNKVSRKEMEICIKNRLVSLKPTKGHTFLTKIPWKAIYTTNYDTLIEDQYKSQNLYNLVKITEYNQFDSLTPNEIPFYKMHGCIQEVYNPYKPLIITYSDIETNKEEKAETINRLMNDLIDTVLFVGYSFNDGIIDNLLGVLRETSRWTCVSEKYAIIGKSSENDKYKFKAKGVNVLESTFDNFFEALGKQIDNDYKNRLLLMRRSLDIKVGDSLLNADPHTKSLIDTYFEYYNSNDTYFNDAKYFYRGGKPSWGNIINNLDVPRSVKVWNQNNASCYDTDNDGIIGLIESLVYSDDPKLTRIKLSGPAAVGKTTLMYRICYELTQANILSLIYKDVGDIRKGLLAEIYKCNNYRPFVVFVDTAASVSMQISRMYTESQEKILPIIFVLCTRENEWNIFLDSQIRKRLDKFNYFISLEDNLKFSQSELLVEKLIGNNIVKVTPERTEKDLRKLFRETCHLMVSLMEVIENTTFDNAISSEYDSLPSELAKNCYGIISLVSRHGLPFKWEILQRTLESLYSTSWEEFINKIVKFEGKGIIREEGTEPNFYYSSRHSYIAEKIVLMHYKGVKKSELNTIETIIKNINVGTHEEVFIGNFLKILVSAANQLDYGFDDIIKLLNIGISIFKKPGYLLHMKGQYLLDNDNPVEALKCFEKNIEEKDNEMYSIHSAGMACFALARLAPLGSGKRQLEMSKAKKYLMDGIYSYRDNIFFYKSLLQVLSQCVKDGERSNDIIVILKKLETMKNEHLVKEENGDLNELETIMSDIKTIYYSEIN